MEPNSLPPPRSGPALGLVLMVQGTASSVGKSLLVAGLCRYFRQLGLRVAPFKSQNMALNSFATREGHEIGRAQAVQARAAGVEPCVDMNPILLKPTADTEAQVVLMGRPSGTLSALAYHDRKREYGEIIAGCLRRLRAQHDLVIIEGAGSPAEINLRDRDIVNMYVAELADAPVLLVGDIDRGGVFAALVGTLALLQPAERARVRALVVNKFRGDMRLFEDGKRMLVEHADCPLLGVVPHVRDLGIADEDSASLPDRGSVARSGPTVDIAVVMFPHLSNYDDFLPLEREPGVSLRYVGEPAELQAADLVILPGTKNTRADLAWLRATGLADVIRARAARGGLTLGICGGYQMLGLRIEDDHGVEGRAGSCAGLGLLPVTTSFAADKVTRQVMGAIESCFLSAEAPQLGWVRGYEIHMGRVERQDPAVSHLFRFPDGELEGCVAADGCTVGTLMHGVLDHDGLRESLLRRLQRERGQVGDYRSRPYRPESEFDRLAQVLREHLDLTHLHQIVGLEPTTKPPL